MSTGSATGFDAARVRADFPALHQEIRGRGLVYLDSAASTHKPAAVIEAVQAAYAGPYSNVHRGVHTLSQRATQLYEGARQKVQRFLGASDPSEIVFVRGTTEAINLVASTLGRQVLEPGTEVLLTGLEHHSNIVPWQLACQATGATLRVVPIRDDGSVLMEDVRAAFGEKTRLVSVAHVSNALGTILPVREIVELAHGRDVPVLLDGAQAVAHTRVDVQEIGCDFYAFSGHKVFGPTGIGALYGRKALLEGMPPYQGGGDMIRTVTFEKTTYAPPPARFEAGTPDFVGAIGLGAALDYLGQLDLDAVARYEDELLDYGTKLLQAIEGVRLIGTAPNKASVLSFVVDGIHPHDLGTILDMEGVAVRAGHHCAQPVMDRFGIPATTRASLALYNTKADLDALGVALGKAKELFA